MNPHFYSDLHLHTDRSFCSPRGMSPANYLPLCEKEGIRLLGISNHVYSDDTLRAHGVTRYDHITNLTSLRAELQATQASSGLRFLLGCEIELLPDNKTPNLLPEESEPFDYVLIAQSHVLNYAPLFSEYDLSRPDVLRRLTVDRFIAACQLNYPVPTGICHPLYPICSPVQSEVLDGMSDACLSECFSLAAERGISIEIHACLYRPETPLNADGLSDRYLRLLAAAKTCGCRFHFGSDAHSPGMFDGVHDRLRLAAHAVGITEEDLWQVARIEQNSTHP